MAISSNAEGFLQKVASGVRPNTGGEITSPPIWCRYNLTNILCKSAHFRFQRWNY